MFTNEAMMLANLSKANGWSFGAVLGGKKVRVVLGVAEIHGMRWVMRQHGKAQWQGANQFSLGVSYGLQT